MCKVGRRMEIVVLVVCINIERRGGGSFLAQKCAKCTKYYSGNHQKWFFFLEKSMTHFFYVFMVVRSLRFDQRLDLRLDQRLHHTIDQNDLIQVLTWDLIWDLIWDSIGALRKSIRQFIRELIRGLISETDLRELIRLDQRLDWIIDQRLDQRLYSRLDQLNKEFVCRLFRFVLTTKIWYTLYFLFSTLPALLRCIIARRRGASSAI